MSDLLERMADKLYHVGFVHRQDATGECECFCRECGAYDPHDTGHVTGCETGALLAEYERDKERLVLLKFERAERELREVNTDYIVLDNAGGKPCLLFAVNPAEDYAFAVVPPLPGPEVFK